MEPFAVHPNTQLYARPTHCLLSSATSLETLRLNGGLFGVFECEKFSLRIATITVGRKSQWSSPSEQSANSPGTVPGRLVPYYTQTVKLWTPVHGAKSVCIEGSCMEKGPVWEAPAWLQSNKFYLIWPSVYVYEKHAVLCTVSVQDSKTPHNRLACVFVSVASFAPEDHLVPPSWGH